ncbi:MAG: hypothetical protein BZY88_03650 [SAR202 cluster bacterium Io17-Chloro-G9]|nr:MAG: hypothetical protein BZY88_03650 [SAR202 cluster bacterium Io17-Chloro-G9]
MGVVSLLWATIRLMVGEYPVRKKQNQPRQSKGIPGRTSVRVRRQWNDQRIGAVHWSDLENPRWDVLSGGAQVRAPQPFVHAYVYCDKVKGNIAHSCNHGPGPHNIKVCLVKKDNSKEVWNYLMKVVGKKPSRGFFIGG